MKHQIKFLIPALVAFVICFLMTAFYNRYASDDFEFLYQYRELGFSGSVKYFYDSWNTRWLAIAWMNIVFIVNDVFGSLIYYHLFSFLLLWISFFRIVIKVAEFTTLENVITSGFLSISFFYSCFSISDVFFWVNTSTMYLFGSIAFLFVIGELLVNRNTIAGFFLLFFSGMYLGASYEPLLFTTLVGSVVVLFYKFLLRGSTAASEPVVIKLIFVLSIMMLAFSISYIGKGHGIRSSFLPDTTFVIKIWVLIKAVIKMVFLFIPSKILTALLFSFPWLLMGMWRPFQVVTLSILKKVTIVFFIAILISLLPLAFILSEMGPERAWTQVSLFLVAYAALLAAYAGSALKNKYTTYNASRLYAVIAFLYVIATGVPEIVQSRNYSQAYDQRMLVLQTKSAYNATPTIVSLVPLPASGWLHSAEISTEADYFTNQHLKKYLDLNYDIEQSGKNPK